MWLSAEAFGQSGHSSATARANAAISIRPDTLSALIEELAGYDVNIRHARVVGIFSPRVLVVDTAVILRPILGHRDRVVVFIENGALRIPASSLVGSAVRISGTARTLLGIQATAEVPWPSALRPEVVERLEIRAAIMATSVRTAEGVELTAPEVPR
jgi:hypothetical protein